MSDFAPAAVKPSIPFATLAAIDIRLGEILAAEEVAGSNKLVRLRVSFGDHTRTILSGMRKERPDLAALAGVRTLFVINLEPRKMAGETSEGMLLDLGYADGLQPAFLLTERPMPSGTRAG